MGGSRILLVEPNHGGHLLVYIKLLASYALSRGDEVHLALSPAAVASAEFQTHILPIETHVRVWVTSPRPGVNEIRTLAHRTGAERTVIPNADWLLAAFAVRPWRHPSLLVLLMMSDPSWDRSSGLKRRLRRAAKAAIARSLSRRRNIRLVRLRAPGSPRGERSYIANDPVILESTRDEIGESAKRLRVVLGLDEDVFWFGIVGVITPWKNVDLVVDALKDAAGRSHVQLGLALIGPIHENYRDRVALWGVEAARGNFRYLSRDRVMTNEEMNAAVKSLDCVVMAYSTNAPNSTLGKAAALGVRLVSAGSDSIRTFTTALGYELHADLQAEQLAEVLLAAVDAPRPEPRTDLGADQMCRSLLVEAGDGKSLAGETNKAY